MRGSRQNGGPEQRQASPQTLERDDTLMGLIDAGLQLGQARRESLAPAADPFGRPVYQVAHKAGEEEHDRHEHPNPRNDAEAAEEQIEQGQTQYVAPLSQR